MTRTLYSPSWYRVAKLRPSLRKQATVHRHNYRGKPWHIVEDRSSETMHRFTPASYFVVGLMNGERTVDAIWRAALDRLGDDAPSQDDLIRLLAQLHACDLLKTDASPEAQQLFATFRLKERQKWFGRLNAPFAWKLPLFNPDALLDRLVPATRWIFSLWGIVLWLGVVGAGLALAALNWGKLTDNLPERVLDPWNLAGVAVAYPLLKLLHELGHAMAVKVGGGRVHDVGLMLILFMPIPYVDASAASGFSSKWRRTVVDAAGMLVELFVAAVALMLWLGTEQPALRAVLFNCLTIGTVSTLLFNGNPLLKFDGYYILSDVLEIPNLAQRSQKYLAYLVKHYLLGVSQAVSPVTAAGEAAWFLIYGPLAAAYRVFLTFSIALFLASQYLLVGVLLALWCVILMGLKPLFRAAQAVASDPDLRGKLPRVALTAGSFVVALLLLAFVAPAPHSTLAEAVAVVPERRQVRAGADGFVVRLLTEPGAQVRAGTPLALLSDPTVDTEARVLKAQMAALEARLMAVDFTNAVAAGVVRAEIKGVREELARVSERRREQTVEAGADGEFLAPSAVDLPDRFLQRGAIFGYVSDPRDIVIRAVVEQSGIGAIHRHVTGVTVWAAGRETRPQRAQILRITPGGRNKLPHKALSTEGGGTIPLDSRAPGQLRTLANVFLIDLKAASPSPVGLIGQRYRVRFEHEPSPLGLQAFDWARHYLLQRFGV